MPKFLRFFPVTASFALGFGFLGLSGLLGLSGCTQKPLPATPEIATPSGPVIGERDGTVSVFKGLPYAAPPVGALRWAAPLAPPARSTVLDARAFGAACMQPVDTEGGFLERIIDGHGLGAVKKKLITTAVNAQPKPRYSEDCLYLNIRTPALGEDGALLGEPRPVMVWIHGGGHQFGSSDFSYYQGNSLAKRGAVLVTINYRLGALGYMAHPALSASDPRGVSGNYGLLDQIEALKWVKANISAYGGDPDNVTVFGESAGAWSVTELMASPLARGLFHKAIGQSGASTYHLGDLTGNGTSWPSGHEGGLALASALGLDERANAGALRAVPAAQIIAAVTKTPKLSDSFHPVRDGVVLPLNVGTAFQTGRINAVPLLMGYNSDEGTLFFPDDPQPTVWREDFPSDNPARQLEILTEIFGQDNAKTLMAEYPLASDFNAAGTQMMGDEIFGVNVRFAARQNQKAGAPSYLYHFTRVPPSEKQTLGAFHAIEIPFVFGTHEKILGLSEDDQALTQVIQNYWINFAKSGNPNGPSLPKWPPHDNAQWMVFGGNNGRPFAEVMSDVRGAKLDALEAGLLSHLAQIAPKSALIPQAGISAPSPQTSPSTGAPGSQ